MHRTIAREQGISVAAHADDGDVHVKHHRDEAQQFVGLAAVADGQHHVVVGHHAEVAVIDVQGIDKERRCAGAGKRGGYLGTDVAALSHARHDDLAFAVENQFHSPFEIFVELRNESQHGICFIANALYGVFSDLSFHNKSLIKASSL